MTDQTLNHILNHFSAKFENIRSDQSPDLLQTLTLSQYQKLAEIDVQTVAGLSEGLELYLKDHLEILNLQLQLKQKKCALAGKLQTLNTKFDKAIEETNERNDLLKKGKIDFLNPVAPADQPVFAVPTEIKKQIPVEPTYSTRVMRETVSQRPQPAIDSVMKPPTYTSLLMSTRKEKKENVPKTESFSLDDSLLNGHDISMVNISDERRRLQFDELDDEETPARNKASRPAPTKTPSRTPARPATERKPLDLYSLPPPPVFTSSSGRVFNQNRD
ncbi:unnamed protein product [Caenorhabditis nigoni]